LFLDLYPILGLDRYQNLPIPPIPILVVMPQPPQRVVSRYYALSKPGNQ